MGACFTGGPWQCLYQQFTIDHIWEILINTGIFSFYWCCSHFYKVGFMEESFVGHWATACLVKEKREQALQKWSKSFKIYTAKCVCPCSHLFRKWHAQTFNKMLPAFTECSKCMFNSPTSFVKHLHIQKEDYYQMIVLWMVQSSYSSLIAKIKIDTNIQSISKWFSSIHKDWVLLPANITSSSSYETFIVHREQTPVTLCKTNILKTSLTNV